MISNTTIVGSQRDKAFLARCKAMGAVVALAAAVSGCGQKGGLYLPTEAAARDRATLPQALSPVRSASAPTVPASPTHSAPAAR